MSDIPTAIPAEAVETQITQDTPCVRCGYNLRGLTTSGACPECAAPVLISIHGNLLGYADPDWLERVRRGTSFKLWNIVLMIVTVAVAAVLAAVGAPPQIQVFVGLPAGILGLWAAFLITTQEPRISLAEDPITLRKIVRGCAVIGFVGNLLQDTAENVRLNLPTSVPIGLILVLGSVFVLAGVVAYFGEFIYYRRFARRIPNEKLVRNTTTVMWGTVIAFGLLALCGLIAAVAAALGGAADVALVVMVFPLCGGLVALVVFGIWYIVLLVRYRAAFASAAEHAGRFIDPTQAPPDPPATLRFS